MFKLTSTTKKIQTQTPSSSIQNTEDSTSTMETPKDEPVTPAGRLFLQPQFNQIINAVIGFKNPINVEAFKTEISNSLLVKHPRFTSLLVVDKHGKEHWRKTEIKINDHIIIHDKIPKTLLADHVDVDDQEEEEEEERIINAILADFAVSSPLSTEKPLWEIHIVSGLKCAFFRLHHALGDGISMMSIILASCKRLNGEEEFNGEKNRGQQKNELTRKGVMEIIKVIWYTIVSVIGFIARILWVKDERTAVSGGDGVELWPRKVATAKFRLEDMKAVKRAVPNATINDVLFGVVSSGFSKYLDVQSSHALKEGIQLTGVAMVNLRKQPGLQEISKLMEDGPRGRWGNQFGMILLPVSCHTKDVDPLKFVRRAKVMLDQKKQSLEAHFAYNIGYLIMSLFGPKVASMFNHRILCNTTFTITNMVGPQEELTFADGNPLTYIRATSSSLPHAIIMHMVSYAGMANMQIQVAKEIITEPRFLAKCFEDALLEMNNAAMDIVI